MSSETTEHRAGFVADLDGIAQVFHADPVDGNLPVVGFVLRIFEMLDGLEFHGGAK